MLVLFDTQVVFSINNLNTTLETLQMNESELIITSGQHFFCG